MASSTIYWIRQDLRLIDNPALHLASAEDHSLIPLYILDLQGEGTWAPGGASKYWIHHSLDALGASFKKVGSSLVLRKGDSLEVLLSLIKETGASRVVWMRRYEPEIVVRDGLIEVELKKRGIVVEIAGGSLLFEPTESTKADGTPYQVFTPFCKNLLSKFKERDPFPAPKKLKDHGVKSLDLLDFELLPSIKWYEGFKDWEPGEGGARSNLRSFVEKPLDTYLSGRDCPSARGTSRLSPHLHFGEISPRQVLRAVQKSGRPSKSSQVYINEIVWREFAYHLIHFFPKTTTSPLRPLFEKFPWKDNQEFFRAWKKGMTGYPIVDAGMRELWTTGWMHNRVRMIVASFLTKDLFIPWQEGAKWFWDTLLDADLASNTLGWQWTAGCGADAAPYFRIFNPILQGEKFDPEGEYVRRWVPELSKLPNRWIHKPFEATPEVLKVANVTLGASYPRPIVDHAEARSEALQIYEDLKG